MLSSDINDDSFLILSFLQGVHKEYSQTDQMYLKLTTALQLMVHYNTLTCNNHLSTKPLASAGVILIENSTCSFSADSMPVMILSDVKVS